MVGYATIHTMLPVFSLVIDKDVPVKIALTYPELYRNLTKGRSLSYKTCFIWVLVSIYQGGVIMFGALLLFEDEFVHMVAISFTALILTELTMVALTVRTWHPLMLLSELASILIYFLSLKVRTSLVSLINIFFLLVFLACRPITCITFPALDADFIKSVDFVWKTLVITAVSCLPLYIIFLR